MTATHGGLNQVFGVAGALQKGESALGAEFNIVMWGSHSGVSLHFRY